MLQQMFAVSRGRLWMLRLLCVHSHLTRLMMCWWISLLTDHCSLAVFMQWRDSFSGGLYAIRCLARTKHFTYFRMDFATSLTGRSICNLFSFKGFHLESVQKVLAGTFSDLFTHSSWCHWYTGCCILSYLLHCKNRFGTTSVINKLDFECDPPPKKKINKLDLLLVWKAPKTVLQFYISSVDH